MFFFFCFCFCAGKRFIAALSHAYIVIDNINVERVQSFQYLGAMFTTNGDGASNIKQRLVMAVQAVMWKSANKELKPKVLRTYIPNCYMGVKHG